MLMAGRKVQTVKDLRKVVAAYADADEKTTVLLDDSPLKAVHQPWSQIIIPEFDKPEFDAARRASRHLWRAADGMPDAALADGADEEGMDNILLGVIGILEAMRHVPNVPAWIRAGHIHSPFNLIDNATTEVTLADLPTYESFTPWFKDPAVHAHWVQKGREALTRCNIPVSHGLLPDGNRAAGCTPEEMEAAWQEQERHARFPSPPRSVKLLDTAPPQPDHELDLPLPPPEVALPKKRKEKKPREPREPRELREARQPKPKEPKEAKLPPQHEKARQRKRERERAAAAAAAAEQQGPSGAEGASGAGTPETPESAEAEYSPEPEREAREYSPSAPVS